MLLSATLLVGAAQAQELQVSEVYGKAETRRGNTWQPLSNTERLGSAVRTGAGQVELRSDSGTVLLDTASSVTVYRGEFQASRGQFYAEGPIKMFVGPYHLGADSGAAFRIDLTGKSQRLATISGDVRLAYGNHIKSIGAGKQIDLQTGHITDFREVDPWYESRFVGRGAAEIEALRGQVKVGTTSLQAASIGRRLSAGEQVATGRNSWAELGFSAGGYLRLQADSALKVLRIDRTTQGQQVWLQLTRGAAWNVLEPGRGGYRITTPTVSTAVRGTIYRVDASGTVKVFEGQVAADLEGSNAGGGNIHADEQLTLLADGAEQSAPKPLVLDELDHMNMALDDLRAMPIDLQVRGIDRGRGSIHATDLVNLEVQAAALSEVSVRLTPEERSEEARSYRWMLRPDAPAWLSDSGELYRAGPRLYMLPNTAGLILRHLPAGKYTLTVEAIRYGDTEQQIYTLEVSTEDTHTDHAPNGQAATP